MLGYWLGVRDIRMNNSFFVGEFVVLGERYVILRRVLSFVLGVKGLERWSFVVYFFLSNIS